MAKKLTGMLNLSKIPKHLITTSKNGDKVIWIDIVPNKDGEDKYGNTHNIQVYDKDGEEGRKITFLGNLKPQEFGAKGGSKSQPSKEDNDDLPF